MTPEIKDFLKEVGRIEFYDIDNNEFNQDTILVNGIRGTEGIDAYVMRIDGMYEVFKQHAKQLDFVDMLEVKNDLADAILKLQNFHRIESIEHELLEYKYNKEEYTIEGQIELGKRHPVIKLFKDVYMKQFEVLVNAERRVKDLLLILDPNRAQRVDQKYLFKLNPKIEFDRIIQRLVNTLQRRNLIKPAFGGNAENFKLLFDILNPNLKEPERIKWYDEEYETLSFFIYTLRDLNFILDIQNAPINHYVKAGKWFCDKDGLTFEKSKHPKTRRFTGRPEKYADFAKRITGDFEAARQPSD